MREQKNDLTSHRSSLANFLTRCARVLVCLFLLVDELKAADVSYYWVGKGQAYLQTNSSVPVLKAGSPFFFTAQVVATNSFAVNSGSINLPLFGSRPLFQMGPSPALGFQDRAPSLTGLENLYGDGTYTFAFFTTHDGAKNLALSLSGSVYPNVPHVSNLEAAQVIDATSAFPLAWDAFTGGTTNDFVRLWVENSNGKVFGTGDHPGALNALDGTATGITIPGQVLTAGHSYLGHLLFEKFTARNLTYAGAPGFAGYWRQTDFYLIASGGGDATPPTVVSIIPANGATGVPVNVPLTVAFSKPMNGKFWMSVGGTTNSFRGVWSADRLTLTVSSSNNWPANTTLNCLFNPSGNIPYIGDSSEDPLLSDIPTAFTTGNRVLADAPAPPTLTIPGAPDNGMVRLLLGGEPYRHYIWQSSGDLTNWTNLSTNKSTASQVEFLDSALPPPSQRFYRVLALP